MSDLSSSEEDVGIMELRNYVIVEFVDGVQLVPHNWISSNQTETFYPENINSKKYDKLVLNTVPYESSWKTFSIKKIWGSSDNFIRAKQKLKIALQLSEAEDLNSEIDEVLAKKKRRELANKRVNRQSTLSPKMIKSQTSKLSNFSIPPLPKDPFKSLPLVITQKRKICNLQSNKFKHSPKEKNCKKLDEVSMASHKNAGKNTRDNESCRKNIGHLYSPSTSQQDWSVDRTFIEVNDLLMASPPMFSPIKSGLKRSILDMTQPKPVKNVAVRKLFPSTQYNSDTSKIDSEAIDNYLMVTPSKLNNSPIISLRGHFQSTPESAHQNVTPIAVSQLMSLTTQSETFSKDSEANVNHGCILKFITSQLPQLNTKLNKIILNQSKHEELLKKILQNKTVHDESFYDNTDLEEFPLHNLDSLKEIDGKLKSDTLFYKCLVKRLKEFGGNNVYMVTKCIMDFLMTDNLGMQISLTGRGTNNKKNEKMSLISLTMFKLITRVILKNVSGSTITSINKAVTGWLKHAKERNGRRESS